jgi:ATP-dependent DNA helicase RecG
MMSIRDADDVAAEPLIRLSGVGAVVAEKLAARGLSTLQDLWFHLPRQYEDRTVLTPIRALQPGMPAQIEGTVEAAERSFRGRPMLRIAIGDGSYSTLVLRFFHFRSQQVAQFAPGTRVRVYGMVWRSCIRVIASSAALPMLVIPR